MTHEELVAAWEAAELRAKKAEAAYRFLVMRSAGEPLAKAEMRAKAAEADVAALLSLLADVWCQFATKANVAPDLPIAYGAPAHDGGLSVLEDVQIALEAAGKLEPAGVAGKDWWRLKT